MLTAAFLYAEGADGFSAFRGKLPHGLTLSDPRGDVESKLGPPERSSGGGELTFEAGYPPARNRRGVRAGAAAATPG